MNLLVDTSVWSLVLRRDAPADVPEAEYLRTAIGRGDSIVTTGIVLQEILQGVTGAKMRTAIQERFAALPFVVPDRDDHVQAADLHGAARKKEIQVGTVDALLAALCLRRDLTILSTDADFRNLGKVAPLLIWTET